MKAIIKNKTEMNSDCTRGYTYDIHTDDGEILMSNQSLVCRPTALETLLTDRLNEVQREYEANIDLEEVSI